MINDKNVGQLFDVIIPHTRSTSMLNATIVGKRHLQKDTRGFFVKWMPTELARDGKLRHIKMSKSGKILVNPHIVSGRKITIQPTEDSYYV